LKSTLLDFYNQYLQGNLQANGVGLQKYSRKNLTKQLVELFDEQKQLNPKYGYIKSVFKTQ
jgi:hypothetical protein